MPYTNFIGYPNTPGARFDLKYYIDVHFALVEKHWVSLGLVSWNVVSFIGDDKAPYIVVAETVWRDAEAATKAFTPGPILAEIMGDVPNFTDLKAVRFSGEQVATSKL